MTNNNKSFMYVEINETFDTYKGERFVKTSKHFAQPFGGGKSIRFNKLDLCRNVGDRKTQELNASDFLGGFDWSVIKD